MGTKGEELHIGASVSTKTPATTEGANNGPLTSVNGILNIAGAPGTLDTIDEVLVSVEEIQ